MDSMEDNKATPTKRTGVKNDTDERFDNAEHGNKPEVMPPDPANATPSIPTEMPAREEQ